MMNNGLRICLGVWRLSIMFSAYTDKNISHLVYTIPPAAALTLAYFPLWTSIDVYKILFLVTVRA